jgi:hypothetical protein
MLITVHTSSRHKSVAPEWRWIGSNGRPSTTRKQRQIFSRWLHTLLRTQICVRSIAETASKRPKKNATRQRLVVIFTSDRPLADHRYAFFEQICRIQNRIRRICVLNAFQTQIFFYVFSTGGPPLLGRTSIIFNFFDGWLPTTNQWSKW